MDQKTLERLKKERNGFLIAAIMLMGDATLKKLGIWSIGSIPLWLTATGGVAAFIYATYLNWKLEKARRGSGGD